MRPLLLLALLLTTVPAMAANWYVHKGASGTNAGTSWTNAWNEMNQINFASVACGDTIWIAGNSTYTTDFTWNKTCTTGNVLQIKGVLATDAVPVASPGWSAAFDVSVNPAHATNSAVTMCCAFVTIDGRVGDAQSQVPYGISFAYTTDGWTGAWNSSNSVNTTDVTVSHVEILGPPCTVAPNPVCSGSNWGFNVCCVKTTTNYTLDHSWVHQWPEVVRPYQATNFTIQYSYIGEDTRVTTGDHEDLLYASDPVTNMVIHDTTLYFSGNDGVFMDNNGMAGAVFYNDIFFHNAGWQIAFGKTGTCGPYKVYTSVFESDGTSGEYPYAWLGTGGCTVAAGTDFKDNILYNTGADFSSSGAGIASTMTYMMGTTANGQAFPVCTGCSSYTAASPLTNFTGWVNMLATPVVASDFHLTSTGKTLFQAKGLNLTSTVCLTIPGVCVDRGGNTRPTTGNWTLGPYEAAPTWFIRADGGTRYSVNVTTGQCDGKADVAYPGTGTNQHCAYNDVRYLWSDNTTSSGAGTWVIAGGDTVVIRGCHALASQQNPSNPNCRLGWDVALNGNPPNAWCYTIGSTGCFNPPVPSGTSGAHTRILGGCAYDSTPGPCNTLPTSPTQPLFNCANCSQLFGGMDLTWTFNLKGSNYVDIQGIELTTHNKVNSGTAFAASTAYTLGQTIFDGTNTEKVTTAGTSATTPTWNTNADPALGSTTTTTGTVTFTNLGPNCITSGNPRYPIDCQHSSFPVDDYAANGFLTNNATGNILFQDIYVHGFSSAGFYGAIGGAITMTRVNSSYNSFAGWNFDAGTGGPNGTGFPNNPTASIAASYVTMDWNGCNQEYPIAHAIPTQSCYSILNGGFGDAWSGQNSHLGSMTCDHCEMANNVKDPFFGPHTAISNVVITNSYAGNNGGQTWKGNLGGNGTWLMRNTLTNNNCRRLAVAVAGQPASYFNGISNADYCRADGASYAIVWPVTGSFEIDNSTFITASDNTAFDFGCWSVPSTVTPINGGTGYTVGDVIYIGANVVATVSSVSAGGVITGMSMTTPGQVLSATAYTEVYSFDLTNPTGASGATFTIGGETGANCGGGSRILRNNNFIGYTNPNNISWNGQTLSFICYSGCQAEPGTSNDSQWTIRSNNNYWGFKAGTFACTYAGETCLDPLMANEPSQTWTSETALDVFDPHISNNSFLPTSGSLLRGAGTSYTGIPAADYFGVTTTSPPVLGAANFGLPPTPIFNLTGTVSVSGGVQF